eukprot:gene18073-36833_t
MQCSLRSGCIFVVYMYLHHREDPVLVEDLFSIWDYSEFLGDCIDKEFGHYSRMEFTQLQFTFEAVN